MVCSFYVTEFQSKYTVSYLHLWRSLSASCHSLLTCTFIVLILRTTLDVIVRVVFCNDSMYFTSEWNLIVAAAYNLAKGQ